MLPELENLSQALETSSETPRETFDGVLKSGSAGSENLVRGAEIWGVSTDTDPTFIPSNQDLGS
jgi:hypothetical protein